jgi:molybdenum cofactor cytidylyltransferase
MITLDAEKIGGLLLAAGGSSRLGRPKQLLQFRGQSLIRRAAETLVHSTCEPVVVVVGAEQKASRNKIAELSLSITANEDWRAGMSSSIKTGLAELLTIAPDVAAVVILLCDQPLINSEMIDGLVHTFDVSKSAIVAAEYDGVVGVPALFSREMFDELSKLDGDKGARDLIRNADNIVTVAMPEAAFDIDTLADTKLHK